MCLCVTKSFLFSGFVWEITDGGFCDHPKPVMSAPFFRVARLVHGFSLTSQKLFHTKRIQINRCFRALCTCPLLRCTLMYYLFKKQSKQLQKNSHKNIGFVGFKMFGFFDDTFLY